MDIEKVLYKVFSKYIRETNRQQLKALAHTLPSGVSRNPSRYIELIDPTGFSTVISPENEYLGKNTADFTEIYVDASLNIPEVRDRAQAIEDFANLHEWVHNSKTPMESLCEILPSPTYSRVFGSDTRNLSNSGYLSVGPDIKAILDRLLVYELLT